MTGTDTVRNVALVGPNGSGKTTLLENLLYVAGAISRKGKTTDGSTVGDSSPEARARQMGVEVNAVSFDYEGLNFTLLDCPGSVEFVQEARNALLGIDAAVVVVEPARVLTTTKESSPEPRVTSTPALLKKIPPFWLLRSMRWKASNFVTGSSAAKNWISPPISRRASLPSRRTSWPPLKVCSSKSEISKSSRSWPTLVRR